MNARINVTIVVVIFWTAAGCGGDGARGRSVADANPDVCAAAFAGMPPDAVPFTAGMSAKSDDGKYRVALTFDPAVPGVAEAANLSVVVTDATGTEVASGTRVDVTCRMMHAGGASHPCPPPTVTQSDAGQYIAKPVVFNMQGTWGLDVAVDSQSHARFSLCLE